MISLVTGASGFIGSHLVDFLLARGDTVVALSRTPWGGDSSVRVVKGDLLDAAVVTHLVQDTSPAEIYHLAGQSFPIESWEQPALTERVNVEGTINLLEAVRRAGIAPSIVVASSSAVYAQRSDEAPIREGDLCEPASPYGVTKLAIDHLTRLYASRYGMRAVSMRPFAWIGTRKTGDVCSDWVRNIVALERGVLDEIAVGELDIVRDFLHISDGIDAMAVLADRGVPGEAYNVSSGSGTVLEQLLRIISEMSAVPVHVRQSPARKRAIDERVKIGDSSKIAALGWRQTRTLEQAVREMFTYWRNQP